MKHDAQKQGLRWLEQAEADRKGGQLLFDGGSYHLVCPIASRPASIRGSLTVDSSRAVKYNKIGRGR
jgi:hypothetical protein